MLPQEVLDQAADLMFEKGRCRQLIDMEGQVCPLGAIAIIRGYPINLPNSGNPTANNDHVYSLLELDPAVNLLATRLVASGKCPFNERVETIFRWADSTPETSTLFYVMKGARA